VEEQHDRRRTARVQARRNVAEEVGIRRGNVDPPPPGSGYGEDGGGGKENPEAQDDRELLDRRYAAHQGDDSTSARSTSRNGRPQSSILSSSFSVQSQSEQAQGSEPSRSRHLRR